MKNLFVLLLTSLAMFSANAQEININKGSFGGVRYSQNGELLTMAEVQKAMELNPDALKLIKKSKANKTLATVMAMAGGFLVGFPLGTAIGGGEPDWAVAGVGAGFIVLSIPISSKSYKQGKKAVSIYNSSINSSYRLRLDPELSFISNGFGVGLKLRF